MRRCPTPLVPARPTRRTSAVSTPESRLLERLAAITNSVWFDPAWDPGVVVQDDAGTNRVTAIQSRPIYTQYTVSNLLTVSPAEAFGPNGKRILSFDGARYLSGAAALAALLQLTASYSEVQLASRADASTRVRWGVSLNAAAPDNRVNHFYSGGFLADARQRNAAGLSTQNAGSAVVVTTMHVWSGTYNGSAYNSWVDNVASLVAAGNVRAPAALDDLTLGCQRIGGAPASFWNGLQGGLILCPGTVLSAADREFLQTNMIAYHGY